MLTSSAPGRRTSAAPARPQLYRTSTGRPAFAEFLEERGDFELVEDVIDAEYREVDDEAEADSDDDQADGEFDVDAFLDRTPVDDVEEDIHAGEADEHLDTVAEAADRVTVETAVGERRAELAEEE